MGRFSLIALTTGLERRLGYRHLWQLVYKTECFEFQQPLGVRDISCIAYGEHDAVGHASQLVYCLKPDRFLALQPVRD